MRSQSARLDAEFWLAESEARKVAQRGLPRDVPIGSVALAKKNDDNSEPEGRCCNAPCLLLKMDEGAGRSVTRLLLRTTLIPASTHDMRQIQVAVGGGIPAPKQVVGDGDVSCATHFADKPKNRHDMRWGTLVSTFGWKDSKILRGLSFVLHLMS